MNLFLIGDFEKIMFVTIAILGTAVYRPIPLKPSAIDRPDGPALADAMAGQANACHGGAFRRSRVRNVRQVRLVR